MKKIEQCDDCCSEHSGVITRLSTGTVVFGLAITVLLAIFGYMATNDSRTGEAMTEIKVGVAEIKASLPLTRTAIEDLQARTRELERKGGR